MSLYSFVSSKCCEMGSVAPAGNLDACQFAQGDTLKASRTKSRLCYSSLLDGQKVWVLVKAIPTTHDSHEKRV